MGDLERYEAVNKCKTLKQLADVIRSFANEEGEIKRRNYFFSAEKMAGYCENYGSYPRNVLTRNWGIRQQAMMILYYSN